VRPLLFAAVALLLSVLQAALLRWLGGGAFSVALPLVVVVYLALHAGNVEGAVGAAATGWIVDVASGGPKGLMTFLAVALFLLARACGAAIDVQGRLGFAALTLLGTFLFGAAALGFLHLVTPPEVAPGASLLGRVAVEALITALLSPLLLVGLRRVDALVAREDPTLLR
jgi:rod shape-determining protein MreD